MNWIILLCFAALGIISKISPQKAGKEIVKAIRVSSDCSSRKPQRRNPPARN